MGRVGGGVGGSGCGWVLSRCLKNRASAQQAKRDELYAHNARTHDSEEEGRSETHQHSLGVGAEEIQRVRHRWERPRRRGPGLRARRAGEQLGEAAHALVIGAMIWVMISSMIGKLLAK